MDRPSATVGTACARGVRMTRVAVRGRPGMGTCGPFLSAGVRGPLCPASRQGSVSRAATAPATSWVLPYMDSYTTIARMFLLTDRPDTAPTSLLSGATSAL